MPLDVAVIVEGYGDASAVPTLVTKSATLLGIEAYAPNPIRAGEWKKLLRPGVLERYVELANSRVPNLILIVVDLDDGCAVTEYDRFQERITPLLPALCAPVAVCFGIREYEAWFLACADQIQPLSTVPFDTGRAEQIRGAKEAVGGLLGLRYKETQHQVELTKLLPLRLLYDRSRSYRHFLKALSGLPYATIELLL